MHRRALLAAAQRRLRAVPEDDPAAALADLQSAAQLALGQPEDAEAEALSSPPTCEEQLQLTHDHGATWAPRLAQRQVEDVVDRVFLDQAASASGALLALGAVLPEARHTQQRRALRRLLSRATQVELLGRALMEQQEPQLQGRTTASLHPQLATVIVSLPDRYANAMQTSLSPELLAPLYFEVMADSIMAVCEMTETPAFLPLLLARCATQGRTGAMAPRLLRRALDAPSSRRGLQHILLHVGPDAAAAWAVALVEAAAHMGDAESVGPLLAALFCPLEADGPRSHALVDGLLLARRAPRPRVAELVLALVYYSQHPSAGSHDTQLVALLNRLLAAWGSALLIAKCDPEVHKHLCATTVLAAAWADVAHAPPALKQALLFDVVSGVQAHLSSALLSVREEGMAVAEVLTRWLSAEGKLDFGLENSPSAAALRKVAQRAPPPPRDGALAAADSERAQSAASTATAADGAAPAVDSDKPRVQLGFSAGQHSKSKTTLDEHAGRTQTAGINDNGESDDSDDSDDEPEALQPFEDADTLKHAKHEPRFIHDCLEGLQAKNDYERYQASLQGLTPLIRRRPGELKELAEGLVRRLVHLANDYNIDDFRTHKLNAMVALTCACPREVAPYLTTEFYTEDYSVSQRVDMLEAISRAAITMSARHPTATAATAAASKAVASGADSGGPAPAQSLPPSRQDVVRARLEARTRRFHRPRPAAPTPAPPNAFTAVAGLFFFPLLNGHDAKLRTFQPMALDSYVLGLLLRTLGTILHCTGPGPLVVRMATAFLDVFPGMQNHPEPHVQRGLAAALVFTLQAVPPRALLDELLPYMPELRLWLQHAATENPDPATRELAAMAMASVAHKLEEAMPALE